MLRSFAGVKMRRLPVEGLVGVKATSYILDLNKLQRT